MTEEICLVIPCYNEANRLSKNDIIKFYNKNKNIHFILVNDGSNDTTIQLLNTIKQSREDRIIVIDLKKNKGKGEAVRKGVLFALYLKKFSVIGFLDADLSTPLKEVSKLISHFNNDVLFVYGSRFQRVGFQIKRKSYRHYLGRVFATIASNMLKLHVYDTQCGAKFFKSTIIEYLFLEKFNSNWIFDLEIFYRFINNNKNSDINTIAKEIALENWEDINGSKIKLKHVLKIPYDMMKLYFLYRNK